jgi:metal-responsive CopG/Arc/MetJ family transcriptional regulator
MYMKAVQILMDESLLHSLDARAKRTHRDRSKIIREAVSRYLALLEAREKDLRVIEAYQRKPLSREELEWLQAGKWPTE